MCIKQITQNLTFSQRKKNIGLLLLTISLFSSNYWIMQSYKRWLESHDELLLKLLSSISYAIGTTGGEFLRVEHKGTTMS